MITKYFEDITSIHSQLANSTFPIHTLSYLCSSQQQFLYFYKYLATHIMNCQPFQLYFHHTTMITSFIFYLRFEKRDPARSVKHKIILVWPYCHQPCTTAYTISLCSYYTVKILCYGDNFLSTLDPNIYKMLPQHLSMLPQSITILQLHSTKQNCSMYMQLASQLQCKQ